MKHEGSPTTPDRRIRHRLIAPRELRKGPRGGSLARCLMVLVLAGSLHAGGRREDPLDRIDLLINQKQYDRAIQALVVYIRENPQDFERAYQRIRRVGGIRGHYNRLTNELLNTIITDPGNVEQVLAITRQIEALESSETFRAQEFIVRVQALAQFTINRRRLEDILERGRELTGAGKFQEALRVYAGGLDMYQEEFFSLGYGDTVEIPIRECLSRLERGIAAFETSTESLGRRMAELERVLGRPASFREAGAVGNAAPSRITEGDELFDRALLELDTLASFRGTLDGIGRSVTGQFRILQEADDTLGDGSFLPFAARLIYGHSGDGKQDGMIHALDSCWASRINSLERVVDAAVLAFYRRALASAGGRNYSGAEAEFAEALSYSSMVRDLLEKNRSFWEPFGESVERIAGIPVLSADAFDLLSHLSLEFAISRSQQTERLERGLETILARADTDSEGRNPEGERAVPGPGPGNPGPGPGPGNPDPGIAGWDGGERERFRGFFDEAESLTGELRGAAAEFRLHLERAAAGGGESGETEGAAGTGGLGGAQGSALGGSPAVRSLSAEGAAADILRYTQDALALVENFRSRCGDAERDRAARYYTALNRELRDRLEDRQAQYDAGDRLLAGLSREAAAIFEGTGVASPAGPEGTPGGEPSGDGDRTPEAEGLRLYYPREAQAELDRMIGTLDGDIAYGRELFSRYEGERRELRESAEIQSLRSSTLALGAELEALRVRGDEGLRLAAGRAARADNFRAQGDRYYREAREAVDREDFSAARGRIQQAAERYNESLAIQESAALRREWDTRMLALGREIGQREYEAVIREVRELVNRARNEYFAENLESAQELLIRGQNRWNVATVEENPEISYWLSMVRGGLALRSGRVLPATAPLFTEMAQLLNDAHRNYEEGAALIRANRRSEGLARFNNARQKTQEVKLVFPVNQEAGMLELRMDQIADPDTFNASFQRRLNEAIAGIRRGSSESFADLQNLAELNPGFPGIQSALGQAEIDLGYRTVPPDPRILRRSDELTQAARLIVDANLRDQFEAALRQLDEALRLNPNNNQAMTLKDRIQTRTGVGNAVLSSEAEGEYQRAVRELQQGNTLVAMSIVEQLLRNPEHHNSTRILELRRRITTVL